jgi:hypothetical protein
MQLFRTANYPHCNLIALQIKFIGGTMSLRLPEGSLGDFFERVLMALYIAHLRNEQSGVGGLLWLPGSALADVLGGRWSHDRHKNMESLQTSGWVIVDQQQRNASQHVWIYALTDDAISEMDRKYDKALTKALVTED